MARAAVDRSAGQCQSFRGRADGDFLAYLAARCWMIEQAKYSYHRIYQELISSCTTCMLAWSQVACPEEHPCHVVDLHSP